MFMNEYNFAFLQLYKDSCWHRSFNTTKLQDTHNLSPVGPRSNQSAAVGAPQTDICKHVLPSYQEYCWVAWGL